MLIRFESEIFNSGEWRVQDAGRDSVGTGVFDTDTAAAGALFSVTRTGTDTYDVLLDPLGEGPSYMASHTFAFAGVPVDWIQFTLNNTVTDTNTPPTKATDFYISSMRIVPEPGTWSLLLLGSAGVLLGMARRRTDEYFDDGEWRVESAT
jgi:hypothetical protein